MAGQFSLILLLTTKFKVKATADAVPICTMIPTVPRKKTAGTEITSAPKDENTDMRARDLIALAPLIRLLYVVVKDATGTETAIMITYSRAELSPTRMEEIQLERMIRTTAAIAEQHVTMTTAEWNDLETLSYSFDSKYWLRYLISPVAKPRVAMPAISP